MQIEMIQKQTACNETQMEAIRELMLAASTRNEWLTLAEIAEPTEFGEASISAQLRHLRKPQHGGYCVEKRRRRMLAMQSETIVDANHAGLWGASSAVWEYRVFTRQ